MCLTFQMMTLEKYLTKNFEFFFRGYPLSGPSKCCVSKNDHPSTAYDPTYLLQNPFPLKNVDICKKLEINPLRFDQDIRNLSQRNYFQKANFKFPLIFFSRFKLYINILDIHFSSVISKQLTINFWLFFSANSKNYSSIK